MSLAAMVWALKHAPVVDPIAHLVLIGLADHAGDDGTGARPSVATLATYARCSVRSVHNKLRALEEAGAIVRGDQQAVAHLPANRRPVVYDLPLPGVHDLQGNGSGVHAATARGARAGSSGVHAVADRTVHEPSKEPDTVAPAALPGMFEGFDKFWEVYPRRVAKDRARRAWVAAVKRAGSVDVIVEGARRYRDDRNRVEAFTAHPATWLAGGRWDDDPLPARGGDDPRPVAVSTVPEARAKRCPEHPYMALPCSACRADWLAGMRAAPVAGTRYVDDVDDDQERAAGVSLSDG